ncbi:rpoE leader peptide RseD [Erwinia sp. CPCC 100877]|nr:rpoE leader peptide RseD [Erwinia sp. CPCC 100877]
MDNRHSNPLLAHGAEFGGHFDYAWEFSLRRHYLG